MNIVELNQVSHSYSTNQFITNLSLSFEANKTTAIIGRSGSGKSTLLQFVNGLIRPNSGSVSVLGERLNTETISTTRLKIGYLVQGTGLFPHMTVEDNIAISGKLTDLKLNANRLEELMTIVGLPLSFRKKYPHQLSGGEQQRVGICRALYLNPPLLLMDEPLGALDPITRKEIQQEILHLQKIEPRTILFVTHDMREAKILADFILVIDNGNVQQFDTKENVLHNPANGVVKELIEASLT